MSHTILSILEYGMMPFLLVVSTVLVKYMTRQSNRIEWREFLSIGLDILLMCSFACFIFGISLYNHSEKKQDTEDIVMICVLSSFFVFIMTVFLALLIRHWGEHTLLAFWVQNICGIVCLILFLYFVSAVNVKLTKKQERDTTEIHSLKTVVDSVVKKP